MLFSAKTLKVFTIVCICFNTAIAQKKVVIDSLLILVESNISSKEKVNVYVKIAQEYSASDSVNTKKYTNKAIILAKEFYYQEGEIDALYELGLNYFNIRNYSRAEDTFLKIIEKADSADYPKGMANGLNGLGILYWRNGIYDKALISHFKSLEIREEIGDKLAYSNSLNNIGLVYHVQGNYKKALEYYLKALVIKKEIGDIKEQVSNYNNIGAIYKYQGNYSKALDYYYQALNFNEESGDNIRISSNLMNIGNIYLEQGDYKKALDCYLRSLQHNSGSGDIWKVANIYNLIGIVYQRLNKYDKALHYQFKALKIREELEKKVEIINSYNNIASIYEATSNHEKAIGYSSKSLRLSNEMGLKFDKIAPLLTLGKIYRKQEKRELSRKKLKECFKYAKEVGHVEMLRDVAKELAQLEMETGDYKAAYGHQLFYKQMADSLHNEEVTVKITRMEMDHNFEQEKDSISFANTTQRIALEKDIEQRKLVQLTTSLILVLLLLLSILLFIFFREKSRANKLLAEKSENLAEANESLSEANYEVMQQADNISSLNLLLEKNLDEASKDLLVKNQRLAEYAFYNSHRTRAPLARVLGLIQLLDTNKVDKNTADLLGLILHCIKDLDNTIIKMNDILSEVEVIDDEDKEMSDITDIEEADNI